MVTTFPPRCFVLMHRNSLEFGGYLLFRHPVGPTQKIGYRVGSTRNVAAFQAFYAYLLTLDRYLGPHEVQSGVRNSPASVTLPRRPRCLTALGARLGRMQVPAPNVSMRAALNMSQLSLVMLTSPTCLRIGSSLASRCVILVA